MKTKEEIQEEIRFGDVFESKKFLECVDSGCFNEYDGEGYFHTGECETNLSVWDWDVIRDTFNNFPYVVWYSK